MMRITPSAMAGFATLALAMTAPAHAGVVNGGFETGDFTGWTVTGNTGFTAVAGGPAAHTGLYAAAFGEDAPGSSIEQVLTTIAGATYAVDFWVQLDDSATPNAFSWSWDGVTQAGALVDSSGFDYTHISGLVQAGSGSSTLRFNFTNPNGFFLLDDVAVNVPEPGSLALVLTAVAALAFNSRRRGVPVPKNQA